MSVADNGYGARIHHCLGGPDLADLYARLRDVAAARLTDVAAAIRAYLGPDRGAEPVAPAEWLRRAEAGEVLVLDVRPAEEYRAADLPGTVNIPLDELADRITEMPDDIEVVAY